MQALPKRVQQDQRDLETASAVHTNKRQQKNRRKGTLCWFELLNQAETFCISKLLQVFDFVLVRYLH